MIPRLSACYLTLALLCGFSRPDRDPYQIQQIVDGMTFPGVSVTLKWQDCGEWNAYYNPLGKQVILCNELKGSSPGIIRAAVAHEMGHAVIEQLDIPFTGSEETAADELSAVMLIAMGHEDDVIAMANFWAASGRPEDPEDSHPSDLRRFFTLGCLAIGAEDGEVNGCTLEYRKAVRTWNRLLGLE